MKQEKMFWQPPWDNDFLGFQKEVDDWLAANAEPGHVLMRKPNSNWVIVSYRSKKK